MKERRNGSLEQAWKRLMGHLNPGLFDLPSPAARLRAASRAVHRDLRVWLGLHGGGPPDVPAPGVRFVSGLDVILRDAAWDEEIHHVGVPVLEVEGERISLHRDGRLVVGRCGDGNWTVTTWAPSLAHALDAFSIQLESGEVAFLHDTRRCWAHATIPGICVLSHVPPRWTEQVRRALPNGQTVEIEHIGTFATGGEGVRFVAGPHFDDFSDAKVVVWPGVGLLHRRPRRALRPEVEVEGWNLVLDYDLVPREPLDARRCRRSA